MPEGFDSVAQAARSREKGWAYLLFLLSITESTVSLFLIGWFPIAVKQKGFYVSQRCAMSFSKQIRRQPGLAALSHYLATAWHPGSSKRCAMTGLQLSQSCAGKPSQALQRVQFQLCPGSILLCLRESCWKQQLYDFWEVWSSFACVKSRNTDFKEGSVSFKAQSLEHWYWRQQLWYVIWGYKHISLPCWVFWGSKRDPEERFVHLLPFLILPNSFTPPSPNSSGAASSIRISCLFCTKLWWLQPEF